MIENGEQLAKALEDYGPRSATVVRRFHGQPVRNLANWMRRMGGFQWAELGVSGVRMGR